MHVHFYMYICQPLRKWANKNETEFKKICLKSTRIYNNAHSKMVTCERVVSVILESKKTS